MTEQLVKTDGSKDLIQFDDDKVALIKRTVAEDATDDELELFLHQCRKTGLDPLAKQIYFQKYDTKRGPRISIITGIDGYRVVADRTGTYAGSDEPEFEGRITQQRYRDSKQVPAKATVTVWKIVGGKRVPFTASAYWKEYYPGDKKGHMWFKMPHVMLGKVAEAQALRKAFPADLSGVYTREEMDQAGWEEVEQSLEEPTSGTYIERDETSARGIDYGTGGAELPDDDSATNGDTRAAASPQAQAKRERPKPEPDGDGDDSELPRFWYNAADQIGYFTSGQHAKHAGDLIGVTVPETGEEAGSAIAKLKRYAQLRADGVEQDEAKAIVTGGMGQPDDAEAEKEAT